MLVLIASTAFLTVVLAVLAFGQRPSDPLKVRLQALTGDGAGALGDETSGTQRLLRNTRVAFDTARGGLLGRAYGGLERMQIAAGMAPNAGRFLALWAVVAACGIFAGATVFGPLGLALGLLIGTFPYLWLRRKVRTRQRRILRALPDALDLLVACVEAGLGLDSALVRVSDATDGPLAEEIRLTTGEMALGRQRQEALLDLGTRTGVAELQGFLIPVVQAERAGTGVGPALRVQAAAMRERRRQRAKEKAERIPALMVIPMAIFFLPTLLLVVAAPAFLTLAKVFSGI